MSSNSLFLLSDFAAGAREISSSSKPLLGTSTVGGVSRSIRISTRKQTLVARVPLPAQAKDSVSDIVIVSCVSKAPSPVKKVGQGNLDQFVINNGKGRVAKTTTDGAKKVVPKLSFSDAAGRTCTLCGYIGRNITDMSEHGRSHTKEKPYQCPVCPARFSRTQNMKHHIRFSCVEAQRTGMADQLNEEALKCKTKKAKVDPLTLTHPCPVCIEKFGNSQKLNYHMRVHNKGKDGETYECKFCHAGFYSDRSRIDHARRMHNKMTGRVTCQFCGKNLAGNSSLLRHMKLNHVSVVPESVEEERSAAKMPKAKAKAKRTVAKIEDEIVEEEIVGIEEVEIEMDTHDNGFIMERDPLAF